MYAVARRVVDEDELVLGQEAILQRLEVGAEADMLTYRTPHWRGVELGMQLLHPFERRATTPAIILACTT
jgi:hypothetical protein